MPLALPFFLAYSPREKIEAKTDRMAKEKVFSLSLLPRSFPTIDLAVGVSARRERKREGEQGKYRNISRHILGELFFATFFPGGKKECGVQ